MNVKLADITLDERLQCRAQLDERIVEEYSAVVADGGALPAVALVRTPEGQLLLVDGWHRHAAYKKAGKKSIPADVVEGSWRDAQLAAVKANAHHGLRRSNADKRRATIVLLGDAEWCALSNRELAALAGVSHAYVGELRRHYGVSPGARLDPTHQARVDGEVLPVWREIIAALSSWDRQKARDIMNAAGPRELAVLWPMHSYCADLLPAAHLRADELAETAWPWPEDMIDRGTERRARRVATLDTEADIERALRALLVTEADQGVLYGVLHHALRLDEMTYGLDELAEAWADRPRLWARVKQRIAVVEEGKRRAREEAAAQPLKDEWDYLRAIRQAKGDAEAQEALLRRAPKQTWDYIATADMEAAVRDGAYRENRGSAGPCEIPGCGGWIVGKSSSGPCAWCGRTRARWEQDIQRALRTLDEALGLPGVAVTIRGQLVDAADLELLVRILDAAIDSRPRLLTWLARGPLRVAEYANGWIDSPVPTILLAPDATSPATPPAGAVDEEGDEVAPEGELDDDEDLDEGDDVAEGAA